MKPTNHNLIKLYSLRTTRPNRSRLNATVLIIGLSSLLLAGYLTNKGFEKCLADGRFTTIECEKKLLG